MNNKQWSFFDNSPIKILDLARFDKRITGKRKALGQSGIESVIKVDCFAVYSISLGLCSVYESKSTVLSAVTLDCTAISDSYG